MRLSSLSAGSTCNITTLIKDIIKCLHGIVVSETGNKEKEHLSSLDRKQVGIWEMQSCIGLGSYSWFHFRSQLAKLPESLSPHATEPFIEQFIVTSFLSAKSNVGKHVARPVNQFAPFPAMLSLMFPCGERCQTRCTYYTFTYSRTQYLEVNIDNITVIFIN